MPQLGSIATLSSLFAYLAVPRMEVFRLVHRLGIAGRLIRGLDPMPFFHVRMALGECVLFCCRHIGLWCLGDRFVLCKHRNDEGRSDYYSCKNLESHDNL